MIQSLQRLFQDMMTPAASSEQAEPGQALAVAVLLCEVIRADYRLEEAELEHLSTLLAARFGLPGDEAQALVSQACDETESAVDHHRFLRAVRDGCDYDERVALVREMWSLALVDGDQGSARGASHSSPGRAAARRARRFHPHPHRGGSRRRMIAVPLLPSWPLRDHGVLRIDEGMSG